jgi:NitT/TauT family transport system substrate-binding protein
MVIGMTWYRKRRTEDVPMLGRRMLLGGATGLLAAGSAAGPAAAETTPVTIAIQYGVGYLGVVIADQLGLFVAHMKAAGIDGSVELKRMSGATAINDALISNSIDIGAYGLPGMLIAREKTLHNYKVLGLCSLSTLPYGLYTNVPGIKSVADIGPNERIAVSAPNTPQAELLRMAAEKAFGDAHKLDPQMVSLPHPDATIALMGGHSVSLYFASPPFTEVLDAAPGVHLVTNSKAILGEEITGGMLATTGKFAERPGLAKAIVDALTEANGIIARDPARAATIYLQSERVKLTQAEVEALLRKLGSQFTVAPSGTMAMATFMAKQGELKSPPARWQDAFFPPVNAGMGS